MVLTIYIICRRKNEQKQIIQMSGNFRGLKYPPSRMALPIRLKIIYMNEVACRPRIIHTSAWHEWARVREG